MKRRTDKVKYGVVLVGLMFFAASVGWFMPCGFSQQVRELSGGKDAIIEVEYVFLPPTITDLRDGFHSVMMAGEKIQQDYGEPGSPVLPMSTVQILLSPDSPPAKLYSRSQVSGVEVIPGERVEIKGTYRVEYARAPRPISEMGKEDASAEPELPDAAIYGSDKPFPGRLNSSSMIQYLSGYPILVFGLYPVEYIPAEGKLSYYKSIKVRISLEPAVSRAAEAERMEIMPRRNVAGDRERVLRGIDNPAAIRQYEN